MTAALTRLLPALALGGLLTAGALVTAAADEKPGAGWPLARGDALMTGASKASLPDKLAVLWTFQTGDAIEGAPAVVDGVVYVGSYDQHLYALDLATGKEKWVYLPDRWWRNKIGPIKASPAYYKGAVYVGDSDGIFHCVDAATGQRRWTFETGAEIAGGANFAGERVLFGSHDETLYCLDLKGNEVWRVKTNGPVNGSAVVVDGKTFVAGCDQAVHVIDLKTGKEDGSVELASEAAATAAVGGDRLFVGTMSSHDFQAVDWKLRKVAWTFKAPKRSQPFRASAALTDKLVIAGSLDQRVYALDRDNGRKVWDFEAGGKIDTSSPVVAGGRVYAGALDGKLYVLDLKTGNKLDVLTLDSPVTGSPAVVNGRLLVGTQKGTLYCLGAKP
jgi:outer membrane protein assembly factor BamB